MDAALRRVTGALCASGALQLVQLLFVLGLNKEELPTKHTNRHKDFPDRQHGIFRILRMFRGRSPLANRAGFLQWRIILQSTKRKFAR